MPGYFFILLRFWLRVDDVMFRIFDTRFFHSFGSNEIIREWSVREGKWETIQRVRIHRHYVATRSFCMSGVFEA
jgi:type 2A phosphatase activator TIP41